MSLVLNAVSAIQLCAGCTIEFEPLDTLGATEDPAGVGLFADVLKVGDQGYLVSSEVLGGVVIVYDWEGRYQRELTREGDGPGELRGEPKFASGAGGIVLFEPGSPRLHLYSADLVFTKTIQVAGMVRSVLWDSVAGGWLVSHMAAGEGPDGYRPQLDARILLLDQEGDSIRSGQAGEAGLWHSVWDKIRGAEGTIWTTTGSGMVRVFDQDLGFVDSLQLELPGMDDWNRREHGNGVPAEVNDIRLAPDGSTVWVFAFATVLNVDDLVKELAEAREQGGPPDIERLADTFIYSVRLDPNGLTLVGRDQLDTMVRPLGDGDLAYDLVETPDGNRRVRVGRLRFTKGSG